MVFVDKVEVIKIPAYVLCRIHGRKQVDLRPIREGRENMGQDTFLDLPGCAQLLDDSFLFLDHIFLFHLLPLHPADSIHLLVQSQAGPVDLLLHCFEFLDRVGDRRHGFQLALSHTDDSLQQQIKLPHEPFQPQAVDRQGDQQYHYGYEADRAANAADHLLVVFHGNFPDQSPGGGFHCHGKCTYRIPVLIVEDRFAVTFTDEPLRIRACIFILTRVIDFCLFCRKEMPGTFSVLHCLKQFFKNGLVHQYHHVALAVIHIHGFPGGDHDVLRSFSIFKSVQGSSRNRTCPDHLAAGGIQDLCFHVLRKRVSFRIVQKEVSFRKCPENASVIPHEKQAVDSFVPGNFCPKIIPAADSRMDQVHFRGILQPCVVRHPAVRQYVPDFTDG